MMLILCLLFVSRLVGADHYDDDKNHDDYEDDWLDADKTMDAYNNEIHNPDPEVLPTLLPSTEGALTRLIRETSQIRESYDDDWLIAERAGTSRKGDQVGNNNLEKREETRLPFEDEVEALDSAVRKNIQSKTIEQVNSYASSDSGSLALLQWRLLKKISENGNSLDTTDGGVSWLLNNREALETFFTSGDIQGDKYKGAVDIFVTLLGQDPLIKSDALRLRLAVATAVTFTVPIPSLAYGKDQMIDGMQKYHDFLKWHEQGVLYKPFAEVSAWHLRYVVGSWQQSDELVWARDNAPTANRSPEKIADSCHGMVKYKLHNDAGTSVHTGAAYYYYRPVTLKTIHEVGGVCGAISRFGVGMAQAHGVPALMVGQPGHCAYIHYVDGEWKTGNFVSGWEDSSTHSGIGYTWLRPARYFQLMNEAQAHLTNYRLSEKLRFASLFADRGDKFLVLEEASNVCPHNFDVWHDMEDAISFPELDKNNVQNAILPSLEALRGKSGEESDIALERPVSSASFGDAKMMTGSDGAHAFSKERTAEFEVDFERFSSVGEIQFQWWGWSKPRTYRIYGADESGNWKLMRSNQDEKVDGWFNHWSTLPGFTDKVWGVKVEMEDGKLDPWNGGNWFGIRRFAVIGVRHDTNVVVSNKMQIRANPDSDDPSALVDNDSETVWTSKSKKSWFKVDLKKICAVSDIKFQWADGAREDKIKVNCRAPTPSSNRVPTPSSKKSKRVKDKGTAVSAKGTPEEIQLNSVLITQVQVSLKGGAHKLEGVAVRGVEYGVKDVLKMVVEVEMKDLGLVRKHITDAIDEWDYSD